MGEGKDQETALELGGVTICTMREREWNISFKKLVPMTKKPVSICRTAPGPYGNMYYAVTTPYNYKIMAHIKVSSTSSDNLISILTGITSTDKIQISNRNT